MTAVRRSLQVLPADQAPVDKRHQRLQFLVAYRIPHPRLGLIGLDAFGVARNTSPSSSGNITVLWLSRFLGSLQKGTRPSTSPTRTQPGGLDPHLVTVRSHVRISDPQTPFLFFRYAD